MSNQEITQKIDVIALKEKYNLTQDEQEAVKAFLQERRDYAQVLKKKVAGICGDKAEFYHLPRIIMNCNFYNSDASLMVLNYEKGAGKVLSTGINKDEAKDLIEKLKAFVELCTVEGTINTYRCKVERY